MKFLLSIISASVLMISATGRASAYSQDPRSCGDPRTQFPSYPPCQKGQNLLDVYKD